MRHPKKGENSIQVEEVSQIRPHVYCQEDIRKRIPGGGRGDRTEPHRPPGYHWFALSSFIYPLNRSRSAGPETQNPSGRDVHFPADVQCARPAAHHLGGRNHDQRLLPEDLRRQGPQLCHRLPQGRRLLIMLSLLQIPITIVSEFVEPKRRSCSTEETLIDYTTPIVPDLLA